MTEIRVHGDNGYGVFCGAGLLARAGVLPGMPQRACRLMLVCDDNVAPLYADALTASLRGAGYEVSRFVFPAGEGSKSLTVLSSLWAALVGHGFGRGDAVAALGGGVTGDLAGFAAATYMRGIPVIQFPTTLLAMTDSSVGGKCGINLPEGKNLAGVIRRPLAVVCDTDTLETLPPDEYACGMAEVIKYGVVCRPALLDTLALPDGCRGGDRRGAVITECIRAKAEYVEADEYDTGARRALNFGHTVAHAIEKCSGYTVPHGMAVAAGCAVITRAAAANGMCDSALCEKLEKLLLQYGLPVGTDFSAGELACAAISDKKRHDGKITLIVPRAAGDVRPLELPAEALAGFFAAGINT